MGKSQKALREVAEGIDGVVRLARWELSLATDLQKKVGKLLGEAGEKEPPGRPPENGDGGA